MKLLMSPLAGLSPGIRMFSIFLLAALRFGAFFLGALRGGFFFGSGCLAVTPVRLGGADEIGLAAAFFFFFPPHQEKRDTINRTLIYTPPVIDCDVGSGSGWKFDSDSPPPADTTSSWRTS